VNIPNEIVLETLFSTLSPWERVGVRAAAVPDAFCPAHGLGRRAGNKYFFFPRKAATRTAYVMRMHGFTQTCAVPPVGFRSHLAQIPETFHLPGSKSGVDFISYEAFAPGREGPPHPPGGRARPAPIWFISPRQEVVALTAPRPGKNSAAPAPGGPYWKESVVQQVSQTSRTSGRRAAPGGCSSVSCPPRPRQGLTPNGG
jgi:hypothetical protein